MWENKAIGTEFAGNFCAGIRPLQLGVVLVNNFFNENAVALILHPSDVNDFHVASICETLSVFGFDLHVLLF